MSFFSTIDEYLKGSKESRSKIVFTNGCFDILHVGHVRYLKQARDLGDKLIVGLNSDSSVKRLKGNGRPVNREKDRAEVLLALSCVDHVILFDEDTPLELITKLRPNVLVKGGDYMKSNIVGAEFVESIGGKVEIIPFYEGYSTTGIIEKSKA
ncbi:MAG: RfaE bifunctional protein [uncultured bacterium]|nr:MAG: RfaE bifunctional protein [uncultured bacterium]